MPTQRLSIILTITNMIKKIDADALKKKQDNGWMLKTFL